MAIAFVKAADFGRTVTTVTGSYTIKAGDHRLLVFAVAAYSGNDINNVTYGGRAMTLAASAAGSGSNPRSNALYYMIDPPIGTALCSASGTAGQYCYLIVADYTGVSHLISTGTVINGSAVAAVSVAPQAMLNQGWGIMCVSIAYDPGTLTAGPNTVTRVIGPFRENGLFDSNGPVSAGQNYLTVNYVTAKLNNGLIASFSPVRRGPDVYRRVT